MDSYSHMHWSSFILLVLIHLSISQPQTNLPNVEGRIYEPINGAAPCFRLTNATHQIGCSGTSSGQRGVIEYVNSFCDLDKLLRTGPVPPYVAIMEPECFTRDIILQLQSSPRVNGVVLRKENLTYSPISDSPEKSCPSNGFGGSSCSRAWNPYANNLLFHDFGDFPIMIIPDDQFQVMLQCYIKHNENVTTGSFLEYPLCSAELTADMYAAIDTPTCARRESLLVNYLNGVQFCNALGDHNIWGTTFELTSDSLSQGLVILSTKLDGVSFFPGNFSYGADSEVAGIVVLLAAIEQLSALRNRLELLSNFHPLMYTFFNGETWDYIGSSRMVYDMLTDKFPYPLSNDIQKQFPLIRLDNLTTMIELSQLGITETSHGNTSLFIHGLSGDTNLTDTLSQRLSNVDIPLSLASGRPESDLPPASLNWFRKAKGSDSNFESFVLAGFDSEFNNKFFGSRYDNLDNLVGSSSLQAMASKLANIATAVTQTAMEAAGAVCTHDDDCEGSVSANATLIEELLTCFLVNANCSLFRSVTNPPYRDLLPEGPLERYITVSADNDGFNVYTSVVFQLAAYFGAYDRPIDTLENCWNVNVTDQVFNKTVIPINSTHCYCVSSYTYMHKALSPAFETGEYASTEYSTWTESRWNAIQIRMYLVTHSGIEIGVLMGGLAMTLLTLLIAFQCNRRSDKLFQSPVRYDPYRIS